MRDAPSFFWTPRNGGHWVACGYQTVSKVYRDFRVFGNDNLGIPKPPVMPARKAFIPSQLDPPEHAAYRRLVDTLFTPARLAAMEEDVRALCNSLIDEFIDKGRCEFVSQFALPLPVLIFLNRMGIPSDRYEELAGWVQEHNSGKTAEARLAALDRIASFMRAILDRAIDGHHDDWVSELLQMRLGDQLLPRDDVVLPMAITIFFGGLDTVKNALAHIALVLASRPDLQTMIARREVNLANAVEELLRFRGLVNQQRIVRQDTAFEGAQIRVGEMVHICNGTSGLDPKANACPMAIDLERTGIKHNTFGQGRHFCAGAPLARLELRIFLEEWFARIPQFRLANDKIERSTGLINTIESLHLAWKD
ncbi:cytochrome P450 [Sphingobium sp. MI1205]|uniref:cytochrome P450 n=1 Tax=Sphingobium sp. MI1205 TaxID=407020 RepID=UPI00131439E3|nr:cytochrome P450 [Sphingobium sp. MI1205]